LLSLGWQQHHLVAGLCFYLRKSKEVKQPTHTLASGRSSFLPLLFRLVFETPFCCPLFDVSIIAVAYDILVRLVDSPTLV
jgi:hypothetical protein